MAAESERLLVSLEARVNRYEKDLARAKQRSDKHMGAIEARALRLSQSVKTSFADLATAFAGGFAGGMFAGGGGFLGIARGVRQLISETAALGDEAARAGMSIRAFQEWKAVAEDTRIPLDAMVDAFKELNIRADEFAVTGKGPASEAFMRLGMSPEEVQKRLKDPSALMLELIERSRRLGDTAASVRNFDELFGGTGAEQLVRLLGLADGEIEKIIATATESGRVIDEEMVAKAAEFDRAWNSTWAGFEAGAKTAILNVVDYLANLQAKMTEIGNADFFSWLVRKMDDAGLISDDIKVNEGMLGAAASRVDVATLERREKLLAEQVKNLRDLGFDAAEAERELAQVRADLEAEIAGILGDKGTDTTGEIALPEIVVKPPIVPVTPPAKAGAGTKSREDAFTREMQAAQRRILLMQQETAAFATLNPLVEDYAAQQEAAALKASLLAAAQQEGIAVTPEIAAQIDNVATAYGRAAAEADRLAEKQDEVRAKAEEFASLAGSVVAGFIADLRAGKSAAEALAGALNRVVDKLIDVAIQALIVGPLLKALGGGGGWLSWLGLNKGGEVQKMASGGRVRGPGTGRSDSIPTMLSNGEHVVNARSAAKWRPLLEAINADRVPGFAAGGAAGGGVSRLGTGGGASINFAPTINVQAAQGGDARQNADLARQTAAQVEASLRGLVAQEIATQLRPGNVLARAR
ncbi:MAG: hypothetical protein M9939_01635 [Mesorhizobium sp.]|nr:hypothetical protein [Mesorhizobium sp.]MCO5159811.1 hypothetical protein [Mesorhizobium sp.]